MFAELIYFNTHSFSKNFSNKDYQLVSMGGVTYLFLYKNDIRVLDKLLEKPICSLVKNKWRKIRKFVDENKKTMVTYFSLVNETPLKDSYFCFPRRNFLSESKYKEVLKTELSLRNKIQDFLKSDSSITIGYLSKKNIICFFEKRFSNNKELNKYRMSGKGINVNYYNVGNFFSCFFEEKNPQLNCPRMILVFYKKENKINHISITVPVYYKEKCLCLVSFGFQIMDCL